MRVGDELSCIPNQKMVYKGMQHFDPIHQSLFSNFVELAHDADFDRDFPMNGCFVIQKRGDREYFYYKGYDEKHDGNKGKSYLKYVGPLSDEAIQRRVDAFKTIKSSYKSRVQHANMLKIAGMPFAHPFEGDILQALSKCGIFRLRWVLVGTLAYQTYSGIFGIKLNEIYSKTNDIDGAQFYAVSHAIGDCVDDIQSELKQIDDSFRPLFHPDAPSLYAGFINDKGYKIEFLTPNRGDETYSQGLSPMPALGRQAGAQALRYLDFLIHNPMRSVILHKGGISVTVPTPDRFCIHKIMLSAIRGQHHDKHNKDIRQAEELLKAHHETRRHYDIGNMWCEAFEKGNAWAKRLKIGASHLSDDAKDILIASIHMACELNETDKGPFITDVNSPKIF